MNKKKTTPDGIVMPFSADFLLSWQLWKDFKEESFGFKYKGAISEQMAIKHLVELSDGDEEKAVKIIEQSVRRSWQGFYPLKETTNGKSKQATLRSIKPTNDDLTNRVQSEINNRYGKWETPGSEPHSQAV